MGLMEQCTRRGRLLRAGIFLIGLAALPDAAESARSNGAETPVVSLAFDDAGGVLWKATSRSIAQSINDGRTWRPVRLPASMQGNITSLTISSGTAKSIYVATRGSGVSRSLNGGRTWVASNQGLPAGEVIALAAHSTRPRTVYAYVAGIGIFRSTNAGATWQFFNRGPDAHLVQLAHSNMSSEVGRGWLFAATRRGVRRAMDCFCKWQNAGRVSVGFITVATDSAWPDRIYAGARDGFFISPDGGAHWVRMRSPVAPVTALASTLSGKLYGAINGKVIRSANRGVTWEYIAE